MFLEILEDFLSRQVGWYSLCGRENGGHRRTFLLLTLFLSVYIYIFIFSSFSYCAIILYFNFLNFFLPFSSLHHLLIFFLPLFRVLFQYIAFFMFFFCVLFCIFGSLVFSIHFHLKICYLTWLLSSFLVPVFILLKNLSLFFILFF